jgi:hypothetical protein
MSGLNNLPDDVKRKLLRLMVFLDEIDTLKEGHPHKPRDHDIQCIINFLDERVKDIRKDFLKYKENKK